MIDYPDLTDGSTQAGIPELHPTIEPAGAQASANSSDGALRLGPEITARYRLYVVEPGLAVPARDWLIEGLFPERGIVFFGGLPKSGKTWLGLDAAISIATGQDFLGRPLKRAGTVLYLLGEDDLGDALGRIDALLEGRGLDRVALEGRLVLCDRQLSLEDGIDKLWITQYAKETKPTLIVFDPLARFLSKVEENSASEMRQITNWLRQLQRDSSAALLIVHHTDKDAKGLRGTGDLRALSEATLLLGKKGNCCPVALEVRRGRTPDPFDIELVNSPDGGVRWEMRAHDEDFFSRLQEVRRHLVAAGPAGISITSMSRKLGVRWDTTKGLMEFSGAISLRKGHWYLPENLAPASTSVDASSAPTSESGEGLGRSVDDRVAPLRLEPSGGGEGSEEEVSSSFPPTGGLEGPGGEIDGTNQTPGVI